MNRAGLSTAGGVLVLLLGLGIFAASNFDGLLHFARPLVLKYGKPTSGVVQTRFQTSGKHGGYFVAIEYWYSPTSAPDQAVRVNYDAYQALGPGKAVAIHYLRGCPACVVLDDDHVPEDERALYCEILAGTAAVLAVIAVVGIRRAGVL